MLAHNPLHISGRAAFPHPAPASGDDAKTAQRVGMTHACGRQPPFDVAFDFDYSASLSQEFEFGRGDISTAIAVSSVMNAASATLFGTSLDACGVRRPLLLSIALLALATAVMAMLHPALIVLLALYSLSGVLGAGQTPAAYSKVIASCFEVDRLVRIESGAIGRVPFCQPFIERRSASAWL